VVFLTLVLEEEVALRPYEPPEGTTTADNSGSGAAEAPPPVPSCFLVKQLIKCTFIDVSPDAARLSLDLLFHPLKEKIVAVEPTTTYAEVLQVLTPVLTPHYSFVSIDPAIDSHVGSADKLVVRVKPLAFLSVGFGERRVSVTLPRHSPLSDIIRLINEQGVLTTNDQRISCRTMKRNEQDFTRPLSSILPGASHPCWTTKDPVEIDLVSSFKLIVEIEVPWEGPKPPVQGIDNKQPRASMVIYAEHSDSLDTIAKQVAHNLATYHGYVAFAEIPAVNSDWIDLNKIRHFQGPYRHLQDFNLPSDGTGRILAFRARSGFQFFVKTIMGKTITLEATDSGRTTILHVKKMIEAKEHYSTADMRLIYSGKQLEDGRTLADYRIAHEATLHLIQQMRGD